MDDQVSRFANININFDSLGWALQTDPKESDDPTFFDIAERFLSLADKYDFRYTIFVIGRDLENPAVAREVKRWQDMGHEIGNHSYSHPPEFGGLSYDDTYDEVKKAHDLITKACKRPPVGFIAPGWATSKNLIDILIREKYSYDTSLFPSWFMYLIQVKFLWNFKYDKRRFTIFRRSDHTANLLGRPEPFFTNGTSMFHHKNDGQLLVFPLPTTRYLKIPCWHTMNFIFPRRLNRYVLHHTTNAEFFYYLVHQTDLMDLDDVPP
ncbi:MAG: polysaccharide deacetylase family protein, partial [Methanomicrobiales archaeon]|nr:polysaccharide deacetylase family protein [Methanomicrobiales archaeon]